MARMIAAALVEAVLARRNCEKTGNHEWFARWSDRIDELMATAPHGSGIDAGTRISRDDTNDHKLVLYTSFHHMNEHGYYDGWTEHSIRVRPSFLSKLDIYVTGRNRNDIKEYLHELFYDWLVSDEPQPRETAHEEK